MFALLIITFGIVLDYIILFILRKLFIFSLADLILTSGIIGIALAYVCIFFIEKGKSQNPNKTTSALFAAKHYLIAITFLTFLMTSTQTILNIDRSRSFYILQWIEESPKGTDINDFRRQIDKQLGSAEVKAFNQRLSEHVSRGIIQSEGNYLALSKVGKFIYSISNLLARLFDLNGWKVANIWK